MARQQRRRTPEADSRLGGLVVIQMITTEWTKETRGGVEARVRNATPLALLLPERWTKPDVSSFRLHHIYISERRNFLPREWTDARRGRPYLEVEAFRIERAEDGVRVLLDFSRIGVPGALEGGGGPSRGSRHEELFHLKPGEWGRGIYSERLRYWETSHWGFCKHVLNVGLLRDVGRDVFLATEPRCQVVRETLPQEEEDAGGLAPRPAVAS